MDIENPLGEQDFDMLERALKQSNEIDKAIQKAQRAGISLPGVAEQNRENKQKIQAILTTYKTGG